MRGTRHVGCGIRDHAFIMADSGRKQSPKRVQSGSVGELAALQARVAALEEQLTTQTEREALLGQLGAVRQLLDSVLRCVHIDHAKLPYPARLSVQRFRGLSEHEQDGLTLAVLKEVGPGSARAAVLGCGSNGGTGAFLVQELGWKALFVDRDEHSVELCARLFPQRQVRVRRAQVASETADKILNAAGFGRKLDLLAIDFMAGAYWIWAGLEKVRPRLVAIRFNPAFGADRAVVVPSEAESSAPVVSGYFGASLLAMHELGQRKGYSLLVIEDAAGLAYFARDDLAPMGAGLSPTAFHLPDNDGQAEILLAAIASAALPLVEIGTA